MSERVAQPDVVTNATANQAVVLAPKFRAIYDEQLSYVWKLARRLGVRAADVEDVAHDVFVVVHRRLSDYDPMRPMRPWLAGITFRTVSDYRRSPRNLREVSGVELEAADPGPHPDASLAERQSRELVLRALDKLPDEQRAVFVLHEIEELSMPDVAGALDAPLNTLYSRLRIAREKFATAVRRLDQRRDHA